MNRGGEIEISNGTVSLEDNSDVLKLQENVTVEYVEEVDNEEAGEGETKTYEKTCVVLSAGSFSAASEQVNITVKGTPNEEESEEKAITIPVTVSDLEIFVDSTDENGNPIPEEDLRTVNLSEHAYRDNDIKSDGFWVSHADFDDNNPWGYPVEWSTSGESSQVVTINSEEDMNDAEVVYNPENLGSETVIASRNNVELDRLEVKVTDIAIMYVEADEYGSLPKEPCWEVVTPDDAFCITEGSAYFIKAVNSSDTVIVDAVFELAGDVTDETVSLEKEESNNCYALTGKVMAETTITVSAGEESANTATYDLYVGGNVSYDNAVYYVFGSEARLRSVTSEWDGIIPEEILVDNKTYNVVEIENYISLVDENGEEIYESSIDVTSVSVPKTVNWIGSSAFESMTKLSAINVAAGNSSYKSIDGVLISMWDNFDENGDEITDQELYIYPGAKANREYTIPDGINSIASSAFMRNENLKQIIIPVQVDYVSGDAFDYLTALESINVAQGNERYESVDGVLFDKCYSDEYGDPTREYKALLFYPIAKPGASYAIPEGVGGIHEFAFDDWKGRKFNTLTIPASCTHFSDGVFSGLMGYDEETDEETWGNFKLIIKPGNTKAIEHAKAYPIPIPYIIGETDKISDAAITLSGTSFPYTGSAIEPQVTVKLNGQTLAQKTDYTVFYTNNVNPGTATVTVKGKGVYTGEKSATFTITKSADPVPTPGPVVGEKHEDKYGDYEVTESKNGKVEVAYTAPASKKKTSVTIPATTKLPDGTIAKVTSIGNKVFKNNKKIKKVTIGKNVEEIGKEAFSGATKLTTVKMGTKVTTIGNNAFAKCPKLKAVIIPSKVKKIGSKAFLNCKNLKTITIKTKNLTKKNVGKQAFKGVHTKVKVDVPNKKVKAYKMFLYKKGLSKKAKIS